MIPGAIGQPREPTSDVFTIQGSTREFTHKGLRALYRREFGRLCGRVVNYNMEGAWDHMAEPVGRGVADTTGMKRCRVAWIELSVFAKMVLRAVARGSQAWTVVCTCPQPHG
jgi:hypothetical protein